MTNNIYSPKLATYVKISFEGKIKLGGTVINGTKENVPTDNKRLRKDIDLDFDGKYNLEGSAESVADKIQEICGQHVTRYRKKNKEA